MIADASLVVKSYIPERSRKRVCTQSTQEPHTRAEPEAGRGIATEADTWDRVECIASNLCNLGLMLVDCTKLQTLFAPIFERLHECSNSGAFTQYNRL
jgi:hypothetical protein